MKEEEAHKIYHEAEVTIFYHDCVHIIARSQFAWRAMLFS